MTKRFFLIFYSILLIATSLYGQSSVILDEYIELALSSNLQLRQTSLLKEQQSSKLAQAKTLWNPQVDLSTTYLIAEGGRKILFPIGDLFNPAYLTLNQLTNSEQFPTNLENVETQLTPNNFIDASLSITKPLINSAIKYNVLIQKALMDIPDLDMQQQRAEIAFQVRQAYYNYLKTERAQELLDNNLSLLSEVKTFNQKLIKYDKATPDIISDVDYRLKRLQGEKEGLEQQRSISRILLNTLMKRDIDISIKSDDAALLTISEERYQLDQIIESALTNRSELKKINISAGINELNKKRIEDSRLPTLGVQGGIGLQVEEFSLDGGGPLYTLALNLGWNIWDGGTRKKQLQETQIIEEQQQTLLELSSQQITLEVAQAYYELQSLYAKYDAEAEAITAAQISYDAINRRYKNESALLIELLTAQNQLLTSQLNHILIGIDVLIAQAKIKKVLHEN